MRFSTLTGALVFGTAGASASIEMRDQFQPTEDSLACFYMTNELDWKGEGQNICAVSGQCSNYLPDGLAKNVSSVGPAEDMTCFLYDGDHCTGVQSLPIVHPGYPDLRAISFNDRALSFKCWKYCGFPPFSASSSVASSTSVNSRDTSMHTLTVPASITSTLGVTPSASAYGGSLSTSTSVVTVTSTMNGPAPFSS